MKILTVCKLNQARSILAQSVLKFSNPDFEVFSAGIMATDNSDIPEITKFALSNFGIPIVQVKSKSIQRYLHLKFDFILIAENWMRDFIDPCIGQIVSYEELAPNLSFLPKDPINKNQREFELELAKVFWISKMALYKFQNYDLSKICIITPKHETNIFEAIEFANESARINNSLILDVELQETYRSEFKKLNLKPMSISSYDPQKDLTSKDSVLHFDSNWSNSVFQTLLDIDYYHKVINLAKHRNLVVITAPLNTLTGSLVEPFFTAALPGTIEVFSRN